MKHLKKNALALLFFLTCSALQAQDTTAGFVKRPVIALLGIDARNIFAIDSAEMASSLVIELEKLAKYEVMDRYDVDYLLRNAGFRQPRCFSKICMIEAAKLLKCDKLFSATIEGFTEQIIITLKVTDVKTEAIEISRVEKFLYIPKEIHAMIMVAVNNMFGVGNNAELVTKLTKKNDFDNEINNPYELRLRTDGPRMGFTVLTGRNASYLHAKKNEGGYDAVPVMFQFGYQFEKQYLNEGNFQALFEFIPLVSGIDQGMFIPSFTIMNGLRDNRKGWEFALGPTFSLVKQANGYYDSTGRWQLERDLPEGVKRTDIESRFDNRGYLQLHTGFILAVGRTFRSGKLNMPVNAYVIPSKDGFRYGLSFGFNARDRYTYKKPE